MFITEPNSPKKNGCSYKIWISETFSVEIKLCCIFGICSWLKYTFHCVCFSTNGPAEPCSRLSRRVFGQKLCPPDSTVQTLAVNDNTSATWLSWLHISQWGDVQTCPLFSCAAWSLLTVLYVRPLLSHGSCQVPMIHGYLPLQ